MRRHSLGEVAQVLVTGGTGNLGSAVVRQLDSAGHEVRVLSRRPGSGRVVADLTTGAGVCTAVEGAEVVVHAAGEPTDAQRVDVAGTGRLVQAARLAGVRHLVYVSIVGVDRNPYPYYRAKLAAEWIVRAAGVPFTILRATQFPELVDAVLGRCSRGPFVVVPRGWSVQPVAVADVATRIGELVAGSPSDTIVEYGGPEQLPVTTAAHRWLAGRGRRAVVLPLPVPGAASRAFRAGSNLTADAGGAISWEDWLAARHPPAGYRSS